MTPDEEKKSMSDRYWTAREAADSERDGSDDAGDEMQLPEMDFSSSDDGPPPVPPDVAPPPEGPPEYSPFPGVQTSAAAPDMKARRLEALREASRLAGAPVDSGVSDSDIAGAQSRDREQRGKDAFTESIQAWLQRRPIRFQNPTEGSDAIQRRQLAESSALKQRGQQLSVQEQIAKALTEPKPTAATGGLTEYQKYEMDRNARLEADKKTAAEKKAAEAKQQLERDRTMLQKDFPQYDLSQADEKTIEKLLSLRHAKATEAQAAAALEETKTQHVVQGATDLAKALGDPAAFQAKYDRLMALKGANGGEIPGLGVVEGVRQQPGLVGSAARAVSPPTDQAIESRKLMRQLAAEYARNISGAGVSDKERAQLNAAALDVENDDSRIAMAGLDTLKDMYDSRVAIAKAGARPEAVSQVEGAAKPAERPLPEAPPDSPPPGSIPPGATNVKKLKNGKWIYTLPNGEQETWSP